MIALLTKVSSHGRVGEAPPRFRQMELESKFSTIWEQEHERKMIGYIASRRIQTGLKLKIGANERVYGSCLQGCSCPPDLTYPNGQEIRLLRAEARSNNPVIGRLMTACCASRLLGMMYFMLLVANHSRKDDVQKRKCNSDSRVTLRVPIILRNYQIYSSAKYLG